MEKCSNRYLIEFKKILDRFNDKCGKNQFLTYYLIAAHPGCTEKSMAEMKKITMENENEQLVVEVKDVEKTITLAKGYNTLRDTLNNASTNFRI